MKMLKFTLVKFVLAVGFGVCSVAAMAQLRGGLLPINQAYKVSANIDKPGVVAVHFDIAPEYYLYRGRMKFLSGKGTVLGVPTLPQGIKEHDPYFGNVEIYHGKVSVRIPYSVASGAAHVNLVVGYQGCHEVTPRVCYPPHMKRFSIAVP